VVVIPAKRNWFLILFLGLWLCGWAVGEVMVPITFLADDGPPGSALFTLVWLAMWTIGGGIALYTFLWSLVGREKILLSSSRLAIKRDLFGFGRIREYENVHIRDLRVAASSYNPFDFRSGMQFWGMGGGLIAFDHGAATVRFGASLEESEARAVVQLLQSRASFARAAV
jgi:hypothetical protein